MVAIGQEIRGILVTVIACLLIVVRHSSENPLQYALPVG